MNIMLLIVGGASLVIGQVATALVVLALVAFNVIGVMQRPPRTPGTKIVNTPQIVRWVVTGFVLAACGLAVLAWGPDEPSTTEPSVSMTMAFAVVSLSAVNVGLVMRREREAPWSSPVFPYLGWIICGWVLTWAAVELDMLSRLLDTTSLTGGQWLVVLGVSLIAPAVVAVDKAVQLSRQRTASRRADGKSTAGRAVPVGA